jgi:head-tail adaptor
MQAGLLRERVTVQQPTQVSDGHDGYEEDTWANVTPTRRSAGVVALSGRTLDTARQVDPRASHEVMLRHWSGYASVLGTRSRIVWHDGSNGDRVLEPVEPPRETEFRETVAVICKESA